jgi:hypothetical protein
MSKLFLGERLSMIYITAVEVAMCNRLCRLKAIDLRRRTPFCSWPRVFVESMLPR